MIDTIIAELKDLHADSGNSGSGGTLTGAISDWRIVATKKTGRQRFYIRKALDQKRALDLAEYKVTVYMDSACDGTLYRGEATVTVHPTQAPEEIRQLLARTAFAASKSRTPHFDIPGPAKARCAIPASGFEQGDIEGHMDSLARALFSPDSAGAPDSARHPDHAAPAFPARQAAQTSSGSAAQINSLELFLTRTETRIVNSRGCDAAFVQWWGECEFIVQAEGPAGKVELYDNIAFGEPDLARLSAETETYLGLVAERARALPMPGLKDIPVILRGENAEAILGWFHDNARADAVYTAASPFKIGSAVQGETAVAEPLDTVAEAYIPGLPQSAGFDMEGFPIASSPIIREGVIVALHGPARYAARLGLEAIGAAPLFSASSGAQSLEAMHRKPYLEPLLFSDFQLDPQSGSFGAEVRLAWYFDGTQRIPVTGGSITGSLMANRAAMLRSSERALSTRSLCPAAVMLFSTSVTGAE